MLYLSWLVGSQLLAIEEGAVGLQQHPGSNTQPLCASKQAGSNP
jgi:hypothetical protein